MGDEVRTEENFFRRTITINSFTGRSLSARLQGSIRFLAIPIPAPPSIRLTAGDRIGKNDKPAWMEEKKDWLKDNRWKDVLGALRPCLEPAHVSDPEAPVRACFRYISNHSNFLDYKGALAAGLAIGSGEIESGHRYVFQNRLKISGAWWKMENLRKMIALRVLRANGGWEDCWSNVHQQAA